MDIFSQRYLTFFFLFFLLLSFKAKAVKYTLKDLEILFEQENYQELLDHAFDVLPQNRNDKYEQILIDSATKIISSSLNTFDLIQNPRTTLDSIEKLYASNSLFKRNLVIQNLRHRFFIKTLRSCLKKESEVNLCQNLLSKHLLITPVFIATMASLITDTEFFNLLNNSQKTLLTQQLILSENGQRYCLEPHVVLTLFDELMNELREKKNPDKIEILSINNKIHQGICQNELVNFIAGPQSQKRLKETSFAQHDQKLLFDIKAAMTQIKDDKKYAFWIKQLLNGDQSQESMNKAFNALKAISKDSNTRSMVLNELKSAPFYFDAFVSKWKPKEQVVILKQFKGQFPEYFDAYFKDCFNYLSGSAEFQFGNPTKHCKDLIKSTQAMDQFIDPYLEKKIKAYF